MGGKRSDAIQAAHDRLRQRLEGQLRIVQAFVRAEQQLTAALDARKTLEAENQTRLQALAAENQTRVAKADETIRTRKTERAETLAGLAVIVNDDDETAALANVSPGDVRSARRSVPAQRARDVAAKTGRRQPITNRAGKPTPSGPK